MAWQTPFRAYAPPPYGQWRRQPPNNLASACLDRVEHLTRYGFVRDDLQGRLQMRYRFVVSAKFNQNHSEIAMDCRLPRFELECCLILLNRFLIATHRFLWNCDSRLAQTLRGNRQRVCKIGPDSRDPGAPCGRWLRR